MNTIEEKRAEVIRLHTEIDRALAAKGMYTGKPFALAATGAAGFGGEYEERSLDEAIPVLARKLAAVSL